MEKLKIGKIDVDEYFKSWPRGPLKAQADLNTLVLRLTLIVNSIADRVNDDALDKIVKKTEERVTRLEDITAGYVERGPGR